MNSKCIEITFVSDLTVSDPRFAQASCEFKCITCDNNIIYSTYETGREEWECEICKRIYIIDSVVFNQTYDQDFNPEEDFEIIEVTQVMTELSNSHRFIVYNED